MPIVIPTGSGTSAEVTIEIAFATEPFAATPVWTDVSDWVSADAGISITRGGDGSGQPSPGSCSFILNNADGRFTPGWTGGPYGAGVKVRRKVRVSVLHNTTVYRRFVGYVSGYRLTWPGKVTESAQVQVTCTDLLGVLADTPLRHSHTETVLQSGPVALWPLTQRHAPAFDAAEYDQPALRRLNRYGGGALTFGDTDGQFDSDRDLRTVRVKNGSDSDGNNRIPWTGLTADVDLQGATTAVGFGGWFKWDRSVRASAHLASLHAGGTYTVAVLWDDSAGALVATIAEDPSGYLYPFASCPLDVRDGRWHHVYALWVPGSPVDTITLYVDAEPFTVTPNTDYATSIGASAQLVVGGAQFSDGDLSYAAPQRAWLSHWAVWVDDAATNLDVARIHEDGRRDIRPDSPRSNDRIEWLLDRVNFPTPDRNLEIGVADVPWSSPSRESALAYARDVADTEQGLFFANRFGRATFHARPHRYWDAPAQLVTNPTFESGVTGWSSAIFSDAATLSSSSERARGGSKSMLMEFPAQVNGRAGFQTAVSVVTGQAYIIRGWVWLETGCPDMAPGEIFQANFDRITARDEWVQFEHHWTSFFTGTAYFGMINVFGTVYEPGDRMFVDGFRVYASSSAGVLSWHHPDQSWTTDIGSVVNVAAVDYHRHGGGTVRVVDRGSRAAYGPRRVTAGTVAADANAARGAAELLLAERTYPTPRMSEFAWDLLTWPTVVDNDIVLGLDVGDRFTVAGLPDQAHLPSADLWVEGVTERIARDEWAVRLATSADLALLPDGHWELGTSALDSETILSY